MSVPTPQEIVAYFDDYRRDRSCLEEMRGHTVRHFCSLFDHKGMFTTKFDPYYTDYRLEDIGTEGQRGTEEHIRVAHFLFDANGALREHLKEPLVNLIHALEASWGSDLVVLYYANEMGRITSGSYPAVYGWK